MLSAVLNSERVQAQDRLSYIKAGETPQIDSWLKKAKGDLSKIYKKKENMGNYGVSICFWSPCMKDAEYRKGSKKDGKYEANCMSKVESFLEKNGNKSNIIISSYFPQIKTAHLIYKEKSEKNAEYICPGVVLIAKIVNRKDL